MKLSHAPGQKFPGVWPRWRVRRSVMAIVGLGMAVAHAAEESADECEPLTKENAELARKYAAVAGWQGFFESSETGAVSWTGVYSAGVTSVENASHGQFTLERSRNFFAENARRGVLSWGGDDNNSVRGEQRVTSDQQLSKWTFKGIGSEERMQASGTLPITYPEFSIWLPTKKKDSSLVTVHSGGGLRGKTLALTKTGRNVLDESKGDGTNVRRTMAFDGVVQTDSFVRWYSPNDKAGWYQMVRGGPGVLAFAFESTTRADTEMATPVLTRRSRVVLSPIYEDLELEVTIEGYAKWRPEGSIATPQQPGNSLVARATLKPKAGATKKPPAVKRFRFELVDTSHEPGVCLNWPLDAKDTDFDFRLAAAPGFAGTLTEKGQKNEILRTLKDKEGRPYAESRIDSFDFGGRATLSVVCVLEDGREFLGLMEEGGRRDLPRLPRREGPDWIAQSWREAKQVGQLGALTDDENDPVGDGTKGDGMTLYEEYRGWVENGVHIEGDPKAKDFFIQRVKAAAALPGIGQFQRITGLNVHHKFTEAEFPASRIMNANRESGPHLTDQHGVVVQVMKTPKPREDGREHDYKGWPPGISRAIGGPGNPKMIKSVNLMPDLVNVSAGYAASTVAHELGHCVNLFHHGDGDHKVVWAVVNGKLYEGRPDNTVSEIFVRNEDGDDCTAVVIEEALAVQALPVDNRLIRQMGVDHGQHSGSDECVMRYDDSQTFVYRTLKQHRFINFDEPVGKVLCASATGSGVNDKDRVTMQPRYGPALTDRGDCLHQILVNDAGPSPWRSKLPRLSTSP